MKFTADSGLAHSNTQPLALFLKRKVDEWPTESHRYKERLESVLKMIIDIDYPVTIVDQPAFRVMMFTMDPKFKLPDILFNYIFDYEFMI